MSISAEVKRLQNAKTSIKSAIEEKGVEVGDGRIDTYAEKISQITSGDGSYDEGYEAGQKAEYDKFWDTFQDYGNRIYYSYALAYNWNDAIYNPKYSINSEALSYGFYLSKITDTKVDIIVRGDITGTFQQCTALKSIQKLIVTEAVKYSATFNKCTALENITFEGVIGNDINFKDCTKLTHESLMSIINALKDFSTSKTFDVNNVSKKDGTFDGDYRNYSFKATNCTLNGTTLSVEGINEGGTIIFEVENADITADEVTRIESFIYTAPQPESEFIIDIAPATKKTLTIGSTNIAKLTEDEQSIVTEKGWNLA